MFDLNMPQRELKRGGTAPPRILTRTDGIKHHRTRFEYHKSVNDY